MAPEKKRRRQCQGWHNHFSNIASHYGSNRRIAMLLEVQQEQQEEVQQQPSQHQVEQMSRGMSRRRRKK